MTIAERINLHRCGYSKEEINQLAEAEKAELETIGAEQADPAEAPEQPATAPAANDNVLDAIKELTKAIYSRNINETPQPAPTAETLTDMISKL